MTWRAFGRTMAAYVLPRPKIVKSWVEDQLYSLTNGTSGRSRAGERTETDDAGCLQSRATLSYGNVRHRGTGGGKPSRPDLWGDWSSNRRSYPDTNAPRQ
jgi:hypothetical protein